MRLTVNGTVRDLDVDPGMPLLWALRDHLGLPGAKYGCGIGVCGACTVHLAGTAVRSCQVPVGSIAPDEPIVTIEGLGGDDLHPVQAAWIAEQAPQCGYCQPGQIMQAASLLRDTPKPTDAEIADAMNGNLCRCGAYDAIHAAIRRAAERPVQSPEETARAEASPARTGRRARITTADRAVTDRTVPDRAATDPTAIGAVDGGAANAAATEPFLTSDGFAELPETGPAPVPRGGAASAGGNTTGGGTG